MQKLVLKKIVSFILYFILWLVIFFMGYNVIGTLSNFFSAYPVVHYTILGSIPTIIVLAIIYTRRCNNQKLKKEYLSNINSFEDTKSKLLYLIKTPEVLSEIIACACLLAPFVFFVGVSNDNISVAINLLTGCIIFIVFVSVFFIIDLFLWFMVYISWKKTYR